MNKVENPVGMPRIFLRREHLETCKLNTHYWFHGSRFTHAHTGVGIDRYCLQHTYMTLVEVPME